MGGKKFGAFNVQEIATAAAIEALKLQKNEERMRKRKNRFHNTELLLKHYLGLVEHFENSQDTASEDVIEAFSIEDMANEDVTILAIRRSRIRTIVMIKQMEASLERLQERMIAKGQPEKYEVIRKLYLEPSKSLIQWSDRLQIVAAEIHCGESSVRRWRNEMIDEFSILLFGVDALQLEA